jgi:hypothetical protein
MSDNNNRPAAAQAKRTGRLVSNTLVGLTVCGGAIVLAAWVAYLAMLGSPVGAGEARAVWGQLGDFIGGVTNPLLSFLALIALLMTVKLQADQLNAAREELDESRRSQAQAANQATEQIAAAIALAQAQQRVAVAMERAAGAQELSAVAIADQLAVARSTAGGQADAANAQLTASLFEVAAEVQRAGGAGNGPDVGALYQLKEELVGLLVRSARSRLAHAKPQTASHEAPGAPGFESVKTEGA